MARHRHLAWKIGIGAAVVGIIAVIASRMLAKAPPKVDAHGVVTKAGYLPGRTVDGKTVLNFYPVGVTVQ